ncbi:MAG: hypothetical protein ACRCXK_13845 [Wohlfahrtiimonas sp.]
MRAFEARGLAREYREKQLMKDVNLLIEGAASQGLYSLSLSYSYADRDMINIIDSKVQASGFKTHIVDNGINAVEILIKWDS